MSAVISDQNVQAILQALKENTNAQRDLALKTKSLELMFSGNPALKRANVYVTKTIDLTTAVANPSLLFDAQVDNGGFPMDNLYVLTLADSTAVSHLYINTGSDVNPLTLEDIAGFTAGAVPLTATPANPFRNFEITKVWFD